MKSELFEIILDFTEPILGTVPRNKEVYATYIASKAYEHGHVGPSAVAAGGVGTLTDALVEAETESVQELEEKGWTGFHELPPTGADGHGKPFVFDYYVKGHLKDVGNILKDDVGIKNLRSKIENLAFVYPRRVSFEPTVGDVLTWGVNERPLRAMTMQGPRVSLARSDQLENVSLRFRIEILKNGEVTVNTIESLLEYGTRRGMGQWRNGGWGRYTVRSVSKATA